MGNNLCLAEGKDSFFKISNERFNIIKTWLKENQIALLRSPPMTGKTSMISHLVKELNGTEFGPVISITMLGSSTSNNIDEHFFKEIGISWNDLKAQNTQMLIIIDESQYLYDQVKFKDFWEDVKKLSQEVMSIRLLFMSGYGENYGQSKLEVPFNFEFPSGIEKLRLTQQEYLELVDSYSKKRDLKFDEEAVSTLFELSHGHVGIIRSTFDYFYNKYRALGENFQQNNSLFIPEYQHYFLSTRSFYWFQSTKFTEQDSQMFRKIVSLYDPKYGFNFDESYHSLDDWIIAGIIIKTEFNGFKFTSPLIFDFLLTKLFG